MKTKTEIQTMIDWLGQNEEDADDPFDDIPFIENVRAFKEALEWVLRPNWSKPISRTGKGYH